MEGLCGRDVEQRAAKRWGVGCLAEVFGEGRETQMSEVGASAGEVWAASTAWLVGRERESLQLRQAACHSAAAFGHCLKVT